jgi:predicted DNA-binding transcriptional regulator YafY
MHVTMQRFEPPEGFDLETYLEEKGHSQGNHRITLRFEGETYRWARRRIPAQIETERAIDGGMEVTFYFENLDYVADWLLRYGTQAEVVEPETLQVKLREKALALADQYEPLMAS